VVQRVDVRLERPAARNLGEVTGRDEIVHSADEEERMALGAPVEHGRQRGGEGVAREARPEICDHVLGGQATEDERATAAVGLQLAGEIHQRLIARERVSGAVRRDNQESGGIGAPRERRQEREARNIAPVDVLQPQHHRPVDRDNVERFGQLADHALMSGAGSRAADRLRLARGEQRRHLGQPRRREHPKPPLQTTAARASTRSTERLENGHVRLGRAVGLDALPVAQPHALGVGGAGQELPHERTLADPRLAGHEHDLPSPRAWSRWWRRRSSSASRPTKLWAPPSAAVPFVRARGCALAGGAVTAAMNRYPRP
jgi:hypothetical protein